MARTLNPQLFGPTEAPVIKVDAGGQVQAKKLRELEAQIEVLNSKIEKWVQILDGKIQQVQTNQKNLFDQIRRVSEDFSQQQATLHSRLNERRGSELKTQELLDRHNQLVHRFEARLGQIQKVSAEQEMKLLTYQSTYDEVLREIRNLRRP